MALHKRFKKNLAKLGIAELRLTYVGPMTEEIRSLVQGDTVGWASAALYTVNKVPHVVSVSVLPEDSMSETIIEVFYMCGDHVPVSPPPPSMGRPDDLLELIEASEGISQFSARVLIIAADVSGSSGLDTPEMAFPLPSDISLGDDSDGPIDQIRGIRGIKFHDRSTEKIRYSFILDRPDNEQVFLTLIFYVGARFVAVVGDSLRIADELAHDFGLLREFRRVSEAE